MIHFQPRRLAVLLTLCLAGGAAFAEGLMTLHVDASAPTVDVKRGHLLMGTASNPKGDTLTVNSRYLELNGKPWLPVMGEFHYSRSPESTWAAELHKMKAAGIDVVATYVFWNHHEEVRGKMVWTGNRDLRRFVELAGKAGLKVVVRLGPWAHGEVRYGGVPDWVVDLMPTRGNDAQYMKYVEVLYTAIGKQLKGQLWKDGGPIIGVQVENEYNLRGPGQGEEHISALKTLAKKVGFDVPMYTVTGWDGAVYPIGEVLPVFGGYPDEPWGLTTTELPPKETYAFRFDTRVSGDLGAQTKAHAPGSAEADMDLVPFFGAEYGVGLPHMYRRRTLVSPDDIASMLPVQIGSGVNLLGYYMFHGGRNPVGLTTLEESTLAGGYNDTPRISYDFLAPLGPDGQKRPVLDRMRKIHYFLHDFGARLAPMTVRKPETVPGDATDLRTPRWSVRSDGASGFVFFNNFVRQYDMPVQKSVQFKVKLAQGEMTFPSQPMDLPNGSYFIWPFNLDLDGTRLDYATAQPVARLDAGSAGIVYVLAQTPGLPVEVSIAGKTQTVTPGLESLRQVGQAGGRPVSLLVLTSDQALQSSLVDLAGQRRLVLSEQQVTVEGGQLQLRSVGSSELKALVFPVLAHARATGVKLSSTPEGAFQRLEASLPARNLPVRVSLIREAKPALQVLKGGLAGAAVQPIPEAFRSAATWKLDLPADALRGLDDALLEIDFVGDIGRLFAGTQMLDDWYYTGQRWQIGLRHVVGSTKEPLSVSVLPLRSDAPIYIDKKHRPDFKGASQVAELREVQLRPVYRLAIQP